MAAAAWEKFAQESVRARGTELRPTQLQSGISPFLSRGAAAVAGVSRDNSLVWRAAGGTVQAFDLSAGGEEPIFEESFPVRAPLAQLAYTGA